MNFDCFQPLFGERAIPIKLATLTDRDPVELPYPALHQFPAPSHAAAASLATDEVFRRTFIGAKTLEYDLALQGAENRNLMLEALAELHPMIATNLRQAIAMQPDNTLASIWLFQGMFERPGGARNVSKGAFAQELADKIRQHPARFTAPAYVRDALDWIRIPAPPAPPIPRVPEPIAAQAA